MDLAASRPEPIPVYTEMSSVNPTFLLPSAIAKRGDSIATGLHASVTGGVGQFCTKPGLVFLPSKAESAGFISSFKSQISNMRAAALLTEGISKAYASASEHRKTEVENFVTAATSADSPDDPGRNGFFVDASVFETSAVEYLKNADLNEEIFGPTTLLINADSKEELLEIARNLEGQLTASIHGDEEDLAEYTDLIAILETKAGRLIFNGFSTGVEVCHAMVHGGPYPATSDSRSTAVGSRAITRFARLVCFQNFPDGALPDELKEENPNEIWRMADGVFSRA
jgi:NADP-dependent aldehyde dehydrogenase